MPTGSTASMSTSVMMKALIQAVSNRRGSRRTYRLPYRPLTAATTVSTAHAVRRPCHDCSCHSVRTGRAVRRGTRTTLSRKLTLSIATRVTTLTMRLRVCVLRSCAADRST
jgi:hypothetical protein